MKNTPYKRKPGDFEIRIMPDGRVIMLAPDQHLVELARLLDPFLDQSANPDERTTHARNTNKP